MTVWYKRRKTWKKWPDNDVVESDTVFYYRDKGNKHLITTTPASMPMDERKKTLEKLVGQSVELKRAGRN